MQYMEQELRRVNFLDKVAFMKKLLEGKVDALGNSPKVIKLNKPKSLYETM